MARFHAEVTAQGYDGLYIDDYRPDFYAAWAQYAQAITAADPADAAGLARCARFKPDQYGRAGSPAENCTSRLAAAGDGTNTSLTALQAQYSAWRPYYVAQLRHLLGDRVTLIANVPVPAVSDPNLDGVTVEFEHCRGDQKPHRAARGYEAAALRPECVQTLLAQKALSEASGRATKPVLALWLTHSEVVPATEQCEQLRAAQAGAGGLGPWVREGDDVTDCTRETGAASCVRCNGTKNAAAGAEQA